MNRIIKISELLIYGIVFSSQLHGASAVGGHDLLPPLSPPRAPREEKTFLSPEHPLDRYFRDTKPYWMLPPVFDSKVEPTVSGRTDSNSDRSSPEEAPTASAEVSSNSHRSSPEGALSVVGSKRPRATKPVAGIEDKTPAATRNSRKLRNRAIARLAREAEDQRVAKKALEDFLGIPFAGWF